MCAVCTRLSSSWFLFDDRSRNFCLYCLHSLLCCFLPQRQGSLLIPFQEQVIALFIQASQTALRWKDLLPTRAILWHNRL